MKSADLPLKKTENLGRPRSLPFYKSRRFWRKFNLVFSLLVSGFGAFLILIPFVFMLSTSLKDPSQTVQFPPVWIPNPIVWQNYAQVFQVVPFAQFALNTVTITIFAVIGVVITGSMVAFSFSRLHWPGRNLIFFLIITEMFLPGPVTLIPKFIIFKSFGWINTFLPLIVPSYFGGGAFTIFLMRQFFLTISPELDDAARIDGCSTFGIYWRIILPLAKPAIGISAIFAIQYHWNDFFQPLIYLSTEDHFTLSLGLQMFRNEFMTIWNLLMAGSLMAMLPLIIFFLIAQKYYIQGIVFSGVKG